MYANTKPIILVLTLQEPVIPYRTLATADTERLVQFDSKETKTQNSDDGNR